MKLLSKIPAILVLFLAIGCARELSECNGPEMNFGKIISAQKMLFSNGPEGFLILPNPVDATRTVSIQATDSRAIDAGSDINLQDLSSASKLENDFLKIRIHTLNDSPSTLAKPSQGGRWDFAPNDIHYSEVMAYHGITSAINYVESLGFAVNQERPLYVMVNSYDDPTDSSSSTSEGTVNAYYQHNKYTPESPRYIQVYGDTAYSLAKDRDTFWHEFGHLFNESVSRDIGIDDATLAGAAFVESRAIHECVADYLAESLGNKSYIGKWGAHNFPNYAPGEPLRSAASKGDDKNYFASVATYNAEKSMPESYAMAEWCTRVLWNIREQFSGEDEETGVPVGDRVVFAALTELPKDASITDFRGALMEADNQLHCGLHKESIATAFRNFGFPEEVNTTTIPLAVRFTNTAINVRGNNYSLGVPNRNSAEIFYLIEVANTGGITARNVRVMLESDDPAAIPTIYMQGLGDIPPGTKAQAGTNTETGILSGISFVPDMSVVRSGKINVRLRIKMENGPDVVKSGDVTIQ